MERVKGRRGKVWQFLRKAKIAKVTVRYFREPLITETNNTTRAGSYDVDILAATHQTLWFGWTHSHIAASKRKGLVDAEWVAERMRYATLTLWRHVEMDPEKRAGVPVLRGTRFTVAQLLAELAEDRRMSEIASAFRLDKDQLQQVLVQSGPFG